VPTSPTTQPTPDMSDVEFLRYQLSTCTRCESRTMLVTYEGVADPARPTSVAVWVAMNASCSNGCLLDAGALSMAPSVG
jgi:hypothetical protein